LKSLPSKNLGGKDVRIPHWLKKKREVTWNNLKKVGLDGVRDIKNYPPGHTCLEKIPGGSRPFYPIGTLRKVRKNQRTQWKEPLKGVSINSPAEGQGNVKYLSIDKGHNINKGKKQKRRRRGTGVRQSHQPSQEIRERNHKFRYVGGGRK